MLYHCYAKVNLTLEILRKREDGYHDLASLVHTVSLADDLRVEPSDELITRVKGLDIDPEANLVARAARLLASATAARRGARLSLVKRIPVAAGLGGGSTDAATTLVALNALWETRLTLEDLSGLASRLGSDIPFFIRGGAALMRGRGDRLEALPPLNSHWLVIVLPRHDIPNKTPRLYGSLAPDDFSSGEMTARAAARLARHELPPEDELINGFERAARVVFPGLALAWTEAERSCDRRFFLSGAGPALFALARDEADARQQLRTLSLLPLEAHVARTVKDARASPRFAAETSIGYP